MSAAPPPAGFSIERLEVLEELPVLPSRSEQLWDALARPGVGVDELGRILGSDPGLATRVLRLANSGTYAVAGGVHALDRAVSAVGISALYQLALFHQTQQLLAAAGRPAPPRLVLHGRAVASLATHLAAEAGARLEGLWLGALLHDLGHHVLYAIAPDVFPLLAARVQEGASLVAAEHELLGLDHTAIGLWVGSRWRYAAPLRAAIGDHHAALPDPSASPTIASLVGMADRWSAVLGMPGFEIDTAPASAAALGLGEDPDGARAAALHAVLVRDGVL